MACFFKQDESAEGGKPLRETIETRPDTRPRFQAALSPVVMVAFKGGPVPAWKPGVGFGLKQGLRRDDGVKTSGNRLSGNFARFKAHVGEMPRVSSLPRRFNRFERAVNAEKRDIRKAGRVPGRENADTAPHVHNPLRPVQIIRHDGSEGLIVPVPLAIDDRKNVRRGHQVIKVPIGRCVAFFAPSSCRSLKATKAMVRQRLPLPDVIRLFLVKRTEAPLCQMLLNRPFRHTGKTGDR